MQTTIELQNKFNVSTAYVWYWKRLLQSELHRDEHWAKQIYTLFIDESEWVCCIEGHFIWNPYGWLRCQKQICGKKIPSIRYFPSYTYNLIRFCLLNCILSFVRGIEEEKSETKIENTLNLFIYTNYSFSPVPWFPLAIGNIPFSKTTNVCKFLQCCKFWWYCDFSAFIWICTAMCHVIYHITIV